MKKLKLKKSTKVNFATYLGIILLFIGVSFVKSEGMLSRSVTGQLVPICCYIVMAVSLNLTVGIMGELSLGHAGFMSVGAFAGVITSMTLKASVASPTVCLAVGIVVGAVFAGIAGFLIGIPVLRLRGDYLAIVTLAFGEIIKDLINCLLVGYDSEGLHIILNFTGAKTVADLNLDETGFAIIKGAQGATGTRTIATFTAGFILIMITLIVINNLVDSRAGRAIMAVRDNRIAAESVGIPVTAYKMMAFVLSAAFAGAAGALYGMNFSNLPATKFNFNTSILVLVYVVLGGLGNIWGSILATIVLYMLPEALRGFDTYRMLIYAIVLITVMLATNSSGLKNLLAKLAPKGKEDTQNG